MFKRHYQSQNIRLLLYQINNRDPREINTIRKEIHHQRINNILDFICDLLIIIGCIIGVVMCGSVMLIYHLTTLNLIVSLLFIVLFAIGLTIGIYDYEKSTKHLITVNRTLASTVNLLLTTNEPDKRKQAIEAFITLIE